MSQTKAQLVDAVDGSIVAADLAADCVTTAKVANSAITDAKISGLTSSKLTGALPAISGAALTGISSAGKAKNLIINGAMQVAQRGTSSTTNGYASLDRFRNVYSNVDENVTQSQVDVASGTTPYTLGFRKALKITNGNQTSGDNGNTNIQIWQRIESQYIANSGWNYLSASSYVTLQFWVKSSVAQNFNCYLLNEDTTQNTYPFETGSLTADTWTKITKTIPGNSNLTFVNDSGAGLRVAICPFNGTNRTANSLSNDTWVTFDGSNLTRDNTTTWLTTNDATFEITGVQLELGNAATDFENLSFGDTLAQCQRYYHSVEQAVWNNQIYQNHYFPTTMRANPSITSTSTGPDQVRKSNWYGKRATGANTGGISFNWTADAEL